MSWALVLSILPESVTIQTFPSRVWPMLRASISLPLDCSADLAGFAQCSVVAPVNALVAEMIDQLLDHVNAEPAGPRPLTLGRMVGGGRCHRSELPAVVKNLHIHPRGLHRDPDEKLMLSGVVPRIFDHITDDLVEGYLQLRQRPHWDAELASKLIQGVANDADVRNNI